MSRRGREKASPIFRQAAECERRKERKLAKRVRLMVKPAPIVEEAVLSRPEGAPLPEEVVAEYETSTHHVYKLKKDQRVIRISKKQEA